VPEVRGAGPSAGRRPAAGGGRWEAVGLTAGEYRRVVRLLGREPNDVELGLFGALWSEHCSYKSSRAFLGVLPSRAPHVLLGPGENAGVVDLGQGLALALRIESHNHPSAVEPFQGAATGVGGILRDIFTVGARPVALLDGLRFGPLDEPRSRYLFGGVVRGVGFYGNCVGVPTVGGEVVFDPAYRDNPLVNVACVGVVRADRIVRGRAAGVGNPVLLIGNRTGRDGIHGASLLASRAFASGDEDMRPAVQVGDPFVGKLLLEACLEMAERGCLAGLNDLGAAGIASAAAETAARAGTGVELDLDRVPCREEGMTPYQILLSESQERMLAIVPADREEEARSVCRRWGLEVARVGRVTADGVFRARMGGRVVAEVPVAALTRQAPRYRRPAAPPVRPARWAVPDPDLEPQEVRGWLLRLLASPTVASKRWVYRQYDHTVRTDTVLAPGAADAAVLRIKGTRLGVALALDGTGRVGSLDPWAGGALAVAEAARNVACVGGRALGLTDCLNFGSPEDPAVFGQFRGVLRGLAAASRALSVPVTGGNVSFYNETDGRPVHPTPVVAVAGVLEDAALRRPAGFPGPGLRVALLGPVAGRLDGSEYQFLRWGVCRGAPARPSWRLERGLLRVLAEATFLSSAHDAAEGGLLVALAECVLTGRAGVRVRLPAARARRDEVLFGEAPGRVVVSLPAGAWGALSALCRREGVPCRAVGETVDEPGLAVEGLARWSGEELAVWEEAIPQWMAG
jgi:phosphoribosylformylglycinamidine synthase II